MISLRNFEKFFKDHPETPDKEKMLEEAKKQAAFGILMAGQAERILGDIELSKKFFKEVESDPEHIQIGLEDLAKAKNALK